jgi:vancomycin resistance protein YoaR
MRSLKHINMLCILICIFFCACFCTFFCMELAGSSFYPVISSKDQTIYPGVSVNGVQLGGKNIDEVYGILKNENEQIGSCKLNLHFPQDAALKVVTFKTVGIEVNKNKIWQEAYAQGRSGSWLTKFKTRWSLRSKGHNLPLYLSLDKNLAVKVLEEASQPWYVEAKDARFEITPHDEILIVPEEYGEKIDTELAVNSLAKKINMDTDEEFHLSLQFKKIRPDKICQDLEAYGICGMLSRFGTQFNSAKNNRSNNIQLAASKLDFVLLPPGEIFSFNEFVGPRTKERGYTEADIIQNNRFVPGVGGGICQVSSTLYNAALLANLEIVERYNHSRVISYVEPGLDATVVYGSRDLRFKNNSEGYLIINLAVTKGQIICKIFGKTEQDCKVVIKSFLERQVSPQTVYKEDPSVPQGQYIVEDDGVSGCVVRVERQVYDHKGKLIKKEVISKDYYPPLARVIRSSTVP